jgi:hypothetical protein
MPERRKGMHAYDALKRGKRSGWVTWRRKQKGSAVPEASNHLCKSLHGLAAELPCQALASPPNSPTTRSLALAVGCA